MRALLKLQRSIDLLCTLVELLCTCIQNLFKLRILGISNLDQAGIWFHKQGEQQTASAQTFDTPPLIGCNVETHAWAEAPRPTCDRAEARFHFLATCSQQLPPSTLRNPSTIYSHRPTTATSWEFPANRLHRPRSLNENDTATFTSFRQRHIPNIMI
jgi:hypothetical protein